MTEFIAVRPNVLPPPLCQELIVAFEASGRKAPGRTGQGVDSSKKRSVDLTLNLHPEWQKALELVLRFTAPAMQDYLATLKFPLIGALSPSIKDSATGDLVTVDIANWDRFGKQATPALANAIYRYGDVVLQKYQAGVGGYPHWHSEIFPRDDDGEALHRVLFFMFYLNDVEEGGETEFYYQRQAIRPRCGTMVIAPAGFTHTHRGNVPVSNDKYILTSWLLFRRATEMYGNSGAAGRSG